MSNVAKVVAAVIAVVAVPLTTLVLTSTDCFGISSTTNCVDMSESLKDAVYTGGATLIGLATFGSVVGAKVITGKNEKIEYPGAILMIGGAIGVILTQGFVMLHACCGDMDQTALCTFIAVTIVSSFLIVCGFAYIVGELFRLSSKNQDGEQPPAHDDADETGAKTNQDR